MMSLIKKVRIYGLKTSIIYAYSEINGMISSLTKKSYSQNGEDLVIDRLLKNKKKGFYVDVGAYDPVRFSNTKRFYDKGWSGINIEPDIRNYEKFIKKRKRDINLNLGVSAKPQKLTFFRFFPDTLSTFSREAAKKYKKLGYRLIEKKYIDVLPMSRILKKYCSENTIDFLSVDTEGYDYEVLLSNNWKKFFPTVICVESTPHRAMKNKDNKRIGEFLLSKGYVEKFKNNTNSVYLLTKKRIINDSTME